MAVILGLCTVTGGVTALVAAIILGPRIGRFHDKEGNRLDEPNDIPPHSVTLQFLGTFCLWFGWYGFNPGSVLHISTIEYGRVAALVAANTTLAACAGALSAMFTSTFLEYVHVDTKYCWVYRVAVLSYDCCLFLRVFRTCLNFHHQLLLPWIPHI